MQKYPGGSVNFPEIGSIVSAACLAHDMGNPPFGHSGERAITAYFLEGNGMKWEEKVREEGGRWEDFLHFEGNANAIRLLTHQFIGQQRPERKENSVSFSRKKNLICVLPQNWVLNVTRRIRISLPVIRWFILLKRPMISVIRLWI